MSEVMEDIKILIFYLAKEIDLEMLFEKYGIDLIAI